MFIKPTKAQTSLQVQTLRFIRALQYYLYCNKLRAYFS